MNSDQWEFSHPNFRRGWFDLLKDIKRRKTVSKEEKRTEMSRQHREDTISTLVTHDGSTDARKVENLLHDKDTLIAEVIKLRKIQDATQRMLAATLNELHETRCEQQRTQDTVEKVVSFLSSVVENQGFVKGRQIAAPQKLLMDDDAGEEDEPAMKRPKLVVQEASGIDGTTMLSFKGFGMAQGPIQMPLPAVMGGVGHPWVSTATPATLVPPFVSPQVNQPPVPTASMPVIPTSR